MMTQAIKIQNEPLASDSTASDRVAAPPRWALLLPLLAGILPYINSLNAFWVGDDYNYVVPKTLSTVVNFFNPVNRAVYRPLTWLTWAIDFELFGNEPFGWKATSLLLHLVCCALVFLLLRELVAVWVSQRERLAALPLVNWLPLLATTLFAVHPAHPETVTWTSGRADVAAAPFIFLAAWAFVRWRRAGGNGWRWLALFGVVGAVFGKEVGLIAAPLLLLIDLFVFGQPWRRIANLRSLLMVHWPFLAVPVLYIAVRLFLYFAGLGRLAYGVETHLQFGAGLIDSALGYILLAVGWWEAPQMLLAWALPLKLGLLLLVVALATLVVRLLGKPALFALLWMPAAVVVTYELATPRWFYVGSFGACLLVALVLVSLPVPSTRPVLVVSLAVALIAAWGFVTAEYNARWYESGEVACGLIADIRRLQPDPQRPATFYMGNAPYSYRSVLLFNSGFGQAPSYAYNDFVGVRGYELTEHAAQVQAALADPANMGPNPYFLRYQDGTIVQYGSLAELVAAQSSP